MDRLNEIESRKAELKAQLEGDEMVDLDAIKSEIDALEVEEKSIKEQVEAETRQAELEAEQRKAEAEKINKGDVIAKPLERKEEQKMEMRNSQEYVEAYAQYVKTGDATQCRALLTENVTGTIAVPELVYQEVKTAWDNEGIMALVKKVELKGNLKVNFEISSTGAVKHLEGSQAVSEEELVEGIVTLVPASIKKWIGISDEVYDMRGEAFLRYIYAEIGHCIAKKCADELVTIIKALPVDSATSTTPLATTITQAPANDTIAQAIGTLSDEANNPVIIMNKLTWATFKKEQYDNNYGMDVFEGCKVLFNNTLPAYSSADASAVYAIVGDLGFGAMANFPNGIGNIEFKFDDKTDMTKDIIRILGREYVGLGAVACKAFCLVKKPSASV